MSARRAVVLITMLLLLTACSGGSDSPAQAAPGSERLYRRLTPGPIRWSTSRLS